MHVPRTMDKVYVNKGQNVYVVTWIDMERQLVDLIPLNGHGPRQEDVPWERLHPAVLTSMRRFAPHAAL
jgi:hypothetical protein